MSKFNTMKLGREEYFTPKHIWSGLGAFDLDPCCHITGYPHIAKTFYCDGGLDKEWLGRVWLNPPYGRKAVKWLRKLAEHEDGIALIFARTDTRMFFDYVWGRADAILFIKGRIVFEDINGDKYPANAGAPSCLIAYGNNNSEVLKSCGVDGKYIDLRK